MGKIPDGAKEVYHGILFDVYQKEIEQFDGSVKTFEWMRWYDVVKALCVVDGKILTTSEEQPTKIRKDFSLPGWRIDRWEDPLEAIKRELKEEIGMHFSDITCIITIPTQRWAAEWYRYFYLCSWSVVGGEISLDAWWEKIDTSYHSFEEFLDIVKTQERFVPDFSNWIIRNYILPGKEEDLRKLLFW